VDPLDQLGLKGFPVLKVRKGLLDQQAPPDLQAHKEPEELLDQLETSVLKEIEEQQDQWEQQASLESQDLPGH